MKKQKVVANIRYDGIDIIKIVAILFVPSLHFFLNFGFYKQPYTGFIMILQESVRWVSFTCIGLFILATGFLQCTKKIEKNTFKNIYKYLILISFIAF